jgi:2-polyprenyl-6-hydroxyphenyl methylase/3-demethylubiquinone-9 3-methyltransferase
MSKQAAEVARGERFEFGKNWQRFLSLLDDERIDEAVRSLTKALRTDRLDGLSFLDAGCGSGLFSLAAQRLGARVRSFDFDPQSVACTREVKRRYAPDDEGWTIEEGSVLDRSFLESLPEFDIVYSWGVLHHTGAMWDALENLHICVADGGQLYISVYNDQGTPSRIWAALKRFYNRSGNVVRVMLVAGVGLFFEMRTALIRLLRLQNPLPFRRWAEKKKDRGMSIWHDLVDWVGGYPFEYAKPDVVFAFFFERGFTLDYLRTQAGGHGCNEFVFVKSDGASRSKSTRNDPQNSH